MKYFPFTALISVYGIACAQNTSSILKKLDAQIEHYGQLAHQIWELAEVGYQEEKSSALLQEELRRAGFTFEAGVAGVPTAFVANYGSASP